MTSEAFMPRVAKALIAILCIVSLLDLSWMGLQMYTWARMAQDKPTDMGWTQAVVDAIGTDDPCEMCLFIQSERGNGPDSNRASSVEQSVRHPMSLYPGVRVKRAIIIRALTHLHHDESRDARQERPPVPPPELLG